MIALILASTSEASAGAGAVSVVGATGPAAGRSCAGRATPKIWAAVLAALILSLSSLSALVTMPIIASYTFSKSSNLRCRNSSSAAFLAFRSIGVSLDIRPPFVLRAPDYGHAPRLLAVALAPLAQLGGPLPPPRPPLPLGLNEPRNTRNWRQLQILCL